MLLRFRDWDLLFLSFFSSSEKLDVSFLTPLTPLVASTGFGWWSEVEWSVLVAAAATGAATAEVLARPALALRFLRF